MKIKLTTSRVHGSGRTEERGDVIDVTEAEAERLLAYGQAMPIAATDATNTPPAPGGKSTTPRKK